MLFSSFNNKETFSSQNNKQYQECLDNDHDNLESRQIKTKTVELEFKKNRLKLTILSDKSKKIKSRIPKLPDLPETPKVRDITDEKLNYVKQHLENEKDDIYKMQNRSWFEPKNLLYPLIGGLILPYIHKFLEYCNLMFIYFKDRM